MYQGLSTSMVPEAGLEPARPHQTLDFESNASTIPPFGQVSSRQNDARGII